MAIKIFYSYSKYHFRTDYNTPLNEIEYNQIKKDHRAFSVRKMSELKAKFKDDQGIWRRISFPLMLLYFLVGLCIPILSFTNSSILDEVEESDLTISIIGIFMVLGFLSISGGLGYLRSLRSFNKYQRQLLEYYESHTNDILNSDNYQEYSENRSKWWRGRK